ncbi:MAG: hypothetical protein WED87_05055, partial [Dehalococcoidia bacterium]
YNLMPEKELESLLNLVSRLGEKVADIEDMVGLDASVLGERIEAKTFDAIMKLRAGGQQADQVYLEGEQAQGLGEAFTELQRYIDLVKSLGTEQVRDVPDGVYSVRVGRQSGVFIMLRMPEELSGQVYWRFYPLNETQALTNATQVLGMIEAETDEPPRLELPAHENPFQHLLGPLRAAIDQLAEEYKTQVAEKSVDEFTKRLNGFLGRDDVMEAEPELWQHLYQWRQDPPPPDTLDRPKVRNARRAIRTMRSGEELGIVLAALRELWDGLCAEGLDRPLRRPTSRPPSEQDLQLVCWELVVTKRRFDELVSGQVLVPLTS